MTSDSAPVLRRSQSLGEEVANAVSHGIGALAAALLLPVLLLEPILAGRDAVAVFAFGLFGVTLLLLYLASTLYHALPLGYGAGRGRAKRLFHLFDHCAIYLLIAGSYTPFALGVFRDSWGWPMFAAIWGLATAGVVTKTLGLARHPAVSASIYIGMGWCALFTLDPLLHELPRAGLYWLIAGGVAYTLGVIPFILDERVRYGHFGWHLFVLTGSACHVVAVIRYA
ncbi:MAG: hemolysin III family protein [Gammaproteobacteria bacterium]|nr:hemolysin III family protein [Gammaproteobacteria bacterium]